MLEKFDPDLESIQQARNLAVKAREAMREFQFAPQEKVDKICEAMTAAAMREAARLGQMAHDETGFGYAPHKRLKNEFAAQGVWDSIKDTPTCGVLRRDEKNKIVEIGWPVGVICALTPSTNPTSTAIYKVLISVKARNAVVVCPHPTAVGCTSETVRIMAAAGEEAGMPRGLVSCMTKMTLAGTNELMRHYATSMILATGGPGMVKAAHSCGKPALGVGPGNAPCYVDRSADIVKAAQMIVESKSFDCSTICATEQSVVADKPIADQLRREMEARGAHFLSRSEAQQLGARMFRANGMMLAEYVGKTPQKLGELAGISVPESARILVAEVGGVGPEYPLSREKLTTVLGWYVEDGWHAGCERSIELLKFGGDGHTMILHSTDEEEILKFGIEKPAFRILVNTWGCLGGVGYTTGLAPSMTLAPGGIGGAAVSDNITLKHVLNTKRMAYHLREAPDVARAWGGRIGAAGAPASSGQSPARQSTDVDRIARVVKLVLQQMEDGQR